MYTMYLAPPTIIHNVSTTLLSCFFQPPAHSNVHAKSMTKSIRVNINIKFKKRIIKRIK